METKSDTELYTKYEHAVDESVRMALRIEMFADIIDAKIANNSTELETLFTFNQLVKVIDRPDLKSKIAKCLSSHLTKLSQLVNLETVDSVILSKFVSEIEANINSLRITTTRHIELLNKYPAIYNLIQNNSNICHPSEINGLCFWLSMPPSMRLNHIKLWYAELSNTLNPIRLFLQLTRQQYTYEEHVSEKGFFSISTPNNNELMMITVKTPKESGIFPQISAGKNRLSIHFHTTGSDEKFTKFIRSNYSGKFLLKYSCQVS